MRKGNFQLENRDFDSDEGVHDSDEGVHESDEGVHESDEGVHNEPVRFLKTSQVLVCLSFDNPYLFLC